MAEFRDTHHYDVGVEELFALYRQPEFWRAKYEFMGHRNIEVECVESEDGLLQIQTLREIPVDVPKLARKIISPVNVVTQLDRWQPPVDGIREGTWHVEVRGKPVVISGSGRLAPEVESGCSNAITGEITVKVPMIGKAVSKLLVGNALRGLADEHAFVKQHLASR